MAYGIKCRRCGWQQSDHLEVGRSNSEADQILPGYKTSLGECDGYYSENPRLEEKLLKKDADTGKGEADQRAKIALMGALLRRS